MGKPGPKRSKNMRQLVQIATKQATLHKGQKLIPKKRIQKLKRIAELAGERAPEIKQPGMKKEKYLHPKGRLTQQLRRKATRVMAKDRRREERERREWREAELPRWLAIQLREHPDPDYVCGSEIEMLEYLQRYMGRHDEELLQLTDRRQNDFAARRVSGREKALRLQIQQEREQLGRGLEVPNLMSPGVCQELRQWKGNTDKLRTLEHVKVSCPDASRRPLKQLAWRTEKLPDMPLMLAAPPRKTVPPSTDGARERAGVKQLTMGGSSSPNAPAAQQGTSGTAVANRTTLQRRRALVWERRRQAADEEPL
eukprot:RCo035927